MTTGTDESKNDDVRLDENGDRYIEDLLKQSTFQGMSDGEISKIIDYSKKRAVADSNFNLKLAEASQRLALQEKTLQEEAKKRQDALDKMIAEQKHYWEVQLSE